MTVPDEKTVDLLYRANPSGCGHSSFTCESACRLTRPPAPTAAPTPVPPTAPPTPAPNNTLLSGAERVGGGGGSGSARVPGAVGHLGELQSWVNRHSDWGREQQKQKRQFQQQDAATTMQYDEYETDVWPFQANEVYVPPTAKTAATAATAATAVIRGARMSFVHQQQHTGPAASVNDNSNAKTQPGKHALVYHVDKSGGGTGAGWFGAAGMTTATARTRGGGGCGSVFIRHPHAEITSHDEVR